MAVSRADVWSFITELVTRNPNLGIPALEDGLFVNLFIFDSLYIEIGGPSHGIAYSASAHFGSFVRQIHYYFTSAD